MISVALAGYGYWGKNLARNFFSAPNCNLHSIIDADASKFELIKKQFPSVQMSTEYEAILNDPKIDAVVIATPVFSHYSMAKAALLAGKHVFVEKPMTSSVRESEKLIELAQKNKLVLMPDHTFLYTGAVRKMKQLIMSLEIGKVNYYDSTRINLGLFQADVNVVWDLAPHDISILYHLIDERPISVTATGISNLNNGIENIAFVTLHFQSNMIAHFSCSWSSPVKIRKILVGADKKMILFDDNEVTEKVKVYDTGYTAKSDEERQGILIDYRVGDIYVPKLEMKEALAGVAQDFINAIQYGKEPVSNWKSGLDVVKVLEAAQVSIKQNGKEVRIS
jgi:predicted dehydrogenase